MQGLSDEEPSTKEEPESPKQGAIPTGWSRASPSANNVVIPNGQQSPPPAKAATTPSSPQPKPFQPSSPAPVHNVPPPTKVVGASATNAAQQPPGSPKATGAPAKSTFVPAKPSQGIFF